MAHAIFKDDATRAIIETETDADSPDNETTYGDFRKFVELLTIRLFDTGNDGTLTSDPPNDTTGEAEDTAASFTDDQHNGRTLLFTSGTARGKWFDIDDTIAADDAIYAAGDNLYSAGCRSGDDYKIFFDLTSNADGHDHDGTNSKKIATSIDVGALDTGDYSGNSAANPGSISMTGGMYCFFPQVRHITAAKTFYVGLNPGGTFVTQVGVTGTGGTGYIQGKYISASGPLHWLFGMYEKGELVASYQASDHPCFNSAPIDWPWPDVVAEGGGLIRQAHNPDGTKAEKVPVEIVVANPTEAQVQRVLTELEKPENFMQKEFCEVFFELYEFDATRDADWPSIPIHIGLPMTYRGKPVNYFGLPAGTPVKPIQRVLKKPDHITPLIAKRKARK